MLSLQCLEDRTARDHGNLAHSASRKDSLHGPYVKLVLHIEEGRYEQPAAFRKTISSLLTHEKLRNLAEGSLEVRHQNAFSDARA